MKISKAEKILLDLFKRDCKHVCEECVMGNGEIDLCDNIVQYLADRGLIDSGDPIYKDEELEIND